MYVTSGATKAVAILPRMCRICLFCVISLSLTLAVCLAFSALISHEPEKQTRSDSLSQLPRQELPGDMDACNVLKYLFYAELSASLNCHGVYESAFLITCSLW